MCTLSKFQQRMRSICASTKLTGWWYKVGTENHMKGKGKEDGADRRSASRQDYKTSTFVWPPPQPTLQK